MCVRVYACVCVCVPAAAAHNRRPTRRRVWASAPHRSAAGPDSPPLEAQRRPLQRRSCPTPRPPTRKIVSGKPALLTRPTHRARAPTALHTAAGPDSPPLEAQRRPLNAAVAQPRNLRPEKSSPKSELTNSTINVLFVPARTASQTSQGGFGQTQTDRPPARIGETPGSNCLFQILLISLRQSSPPPGGLANSLPPWNEGGGLIKGGAAALSCLD